MKYNPDSSAIVPESLTLIFPVLEHFPGNELLKQCPVYKPKILLAKIRPIRHSDADGEKKTIIQQN